MYTSLKPLISFDKLRMSVFSYPAHGEPVEPYERALATTFRPLLYTVPIPMYQGFLLLPSPPFDLPLQLKGFISRSESLSENQLDWPAP